MGPRGPCGKKVYGDVTRTFMDDAYESDYLGLGGRSKKPKKKRDERPNKKPSSD